MSPPRILLFGANGWIGGKVLSLLSQMENIQVFTAKSRADDTDAVARELEELGQVTHVMSFIGRTHGTYEETKITTIDYLEEPGKLVENIHDNLFSPVSLALLCKERNVHFTMLS